jgi:hypothetical protein
MGIKRPGYTHTRTCQHPRRKARQESAEARRLVQEEALAKFCGPGCVERGASTHQIDLQVLDFEER